MLSALKTWLTRSRRGDQRSGPRRRIHVPVRALVGEELKTGYLVDLSSKGARICLQQVAQPPEWIDLECLSGLQRGLVRWSRFQAGDWVVGVEFEPRVPPNNPFLWKVWHSFLYS